MTSGSSTVAIAIDQVREVATVWIDPQSEKGKISSKETLSLQSRIQSSPESSPVQSPDMSPGFITSLVKLPWQIGSDLTGFLRC